MATIQASEFKAKCLALMERVAATGETLVITKNGRPVAELHRYTPGRADSPFGLHRQLKITGEVIAPLDQRDWEVMM